MAASNRFFIRVTTDNQLIDYIRIAYVTWVHPRCNANSAAVVYKLNGPPLERGLSACAAGRAPATVPVQRGPEVAQLEDLLADAALLGDDDEALAALPALREAVPLVHRAEALLLAPLKQTRLPKVAPN